MKTLKVGDRVKVTTTRRSYESAFGAIGTVRCITPDPLQKVNHVKNAKFSLMIQLTKNTGITCTEFDVEKL